MGIKQDLSTPETHSPMGPLDAGRTKIISVRDSTLKVLNNIKRHAACLANKPSRTGTNRLYKNNNLYCRTA